MKIKFESGQPMPGRRGYGSVDIPLSDLEEAVPGNPDDEGKLNSVFIPAGVMRISSVRSQCYRFTKENPDYHFEVYKARLEEEGTTIDGSRVFRVPEWYKQRKKSNADK
jgi:hypothetical protein